MREVTRWVGSVYKRLAERITRRQLEVLLGLLLVTTCSFAGGSLSGYYVATGGQVPWDKAVAVLPPEVEPEASLVDIGHFLEKVPNPSIEYGYDYNCVEDAILLARSAHWEGLSAEPARLLFEDGTGHLVLVFPTKDSGYVFTEPQTNQVINPSIGSLYMGKKIIRIERLVSSWVDFQWEVD